MKTYRIFVWAMFFALLPVAIMAQKGGNGWCNNNNNYNKTFNPQTLEEFKGSVVAIENITPEKGMSKGVHLKVKNDKNETMSVHLGPSWYLDNQDIQFAKGDMIVVNGSRITYQNAPAIVAMTVVKGDDVLVLRNNQGNPTWNGSRKGGQAQAQCQAQCQNQCQQQCQGQGKGQGKGQGQGQGQGKGNN
jgi:hypothetical protein